MWKRWLTRVTVLALALPAAVLVSPAPAAAADYAISDFEAAALGGTPAGWTPQVGGWAVAETFNNQVLRHASSSTSGAHTRYDLATNRADLVVDAAFNRTAGASNAATWVAVRWVNASNHVQVGHYQGSWAIRQTVGGVSTIKASAAEAISGWQFVRVVAEGAEVALYVDRQLKLVAEDVTHVTAGDIALYSHLAQTDFDDVNSFAVRMADYFDGSPLGALSNPWTPQLGSWQVVDDGGRLLRSVTQVANAHVTIPVSDADLTVEGRFRVESGAASRAVWFAARWVDAGTYVQAGYAAGAWTIRQQVGGGTIATLASTPEPLTAGWHQVKITLRGPYVVLTVDGESKASTRAASHQTAGQVALYSHLAETSFDSVIAYDRDEMNFRSRIQQPSLAQRTLADPYKTWGSSIVRDEASGTYHYLGNRWVRGQSWITTNRIVHGTATNLTGPYTVAARADGAPDPDPAELVELKSQAWAADMTSNPFIIRIDSTYYLYYIGTIGSSVSEAQNNQQIGVATSSSPDGPWTPLAGNPVLPPRDNNWDTLRTANPTVYRLHDGSVRMVYKAVDASSQQLKLGIASAPSPTGPWARSNAPSFPVVAEDPNVFKERGTYYLLAKVFAGQPVPDGEGIMYESYDGIHWELAPYFHAYDRTIDWTNDSSGPINYGKVERVFVFVEDGTAKAVTHAVQLSTNYTDNTLAFNVVRAVQPR